MTPEEYANKIAESDFHFPHPNFKKYIEEAFDAGYANALRDIRNRKNLSFDYIKSNV